MSLNGTAHGTPSGNGNGQAVGANLAFTKFLFVTPRRLDDAAGTRLRAAGSIVARGFFNDFDGEGGSSSGLTASRENQPIETIQFLLQDGELPPAPIGHQGQWLSGARYVMQVSSRYRPRLQELEDELARRLGDAAEIKSISGAVRNPRYSSAEMQHYISKSAPPRRSGRVSRNAIILPIRKRREWWEQSALERHAYFYPHVDRLSACPVKGHAQAAESGIPVLYRRVFHNPDGYERPGEFDFITYFECADEALPVFDQICTALRDPRHNPEWRFVEEGPMWRGRRVLRW
jgi:hypothetical protein